MLANYKECTIEEFSQAMEAYRLWQDGKLAMDEITKEQKYIIYTKLEADAATASRAGTSYAREIARSSRKSASAFNPESKDERT